MRTLRLRAVVIASLMIGLCGTVSAQRYDDPTRISVDRDAFATLHDPAFSWQLGARVRVSAIYDVVRLPLDPEARDLATAVIEPSYEVVLSPLATWFVGLGLGVAHLDDKGFAAAAAPRVGLHIAGGMTAAATWQVDGHGAVAPPSDVQFGVVFEGTW